MDIRPHLDHPAVRRRALAAQAAMLADSLERARAGGRELEPRMPRHISPASLRRWAADLERANVR